jgi:hypothetical protein
LAVDFDDGVFRNVVLLALFGSALIVSQVLGSFRTTSLGSDKLSLPSPARALFFSIFTVGSVRDENGRGGGENR